MHLLYWSDNRDSLCATLCADPPITTSQLRFHPLKYVQLLSETTLLHFCAMKQNLFWEFVLLFLCVMPLFLEPVCIFQAADESQRVDGWWEARAPGQSGVTCSSL